MSKRIHAVFPGQAWIVDFRLGVFDICGNAYRKSRRDLLIVWNLFRAIRIVIYTPVSNTHIPIIATQPLAVRMIMVNANHFIPFLAWWC